MSNGAEEYASCTSAARLSVVHGWQSVMLENEILVAVTVCDQAAKVVM